VTSEVAHGKASVCYDRLDPTSAARIARFFLKDAEVPELATRSKPRIDGRHSASQVPFGGALEVLAHLGLHVALESPSRNDGAQAVGRLSKRIHPFLGVSV